MRRRNVILNSIVYIIVMSVITYNILGNIAKELTSNNFIIITLSICYNVVLLYINIVVITYIFRVLYKIVTKITLEIKAAKAMTFKLMLPLFYSHALVLSLQLILKTDNNLYTLLLFNPLIYIFQFKQFKNIDKLPKKIILLIPFIIYAVLDIVSISL